MAFFRHHWSSDHILARRRDLLDWQHRDESAGRYNFVVAQGDDGKLRGILGFIPVSRYDSTLRADRDTTWLTTWKVTSDAPSALGVALLRAVSRVHSAAWIGTVGLNAATKGIYDALGYETGRLDRFFLLNDRMREFRLAVVPPGPRLASALADGTRLSPASRADLLALDQREWHDGAIRPRRSGAYLIHRYLDHPFYRYTAYVLRADADSGVIVTRTCVHDGARALRIVDFVGAPNVLATCGAALRQLLVETGAEYVDFYCTQLATELRAAGLGDVRDYDGLVLPSRFEPFERANADLLYSLKGPPGRTVVHKGDADQDRPNRLDS